MTLYLVRGGPEELSIGAGNRLFGHTSGISHAHIGLRGRAVSLSREGGELRVWQLERGLWRHRSEATSVRVEPRRQSPYKNTTVHSHDEYGLPVKIHEFRTLLASPSPQDPSVGSASERLWSGSDEENVVVLRQESDGQQTLVVYDFS